MEEDILNTLLKDTYTLTSLKHKLRIFKTYLAKSLYGGDADKQQLSTEDVNWLKSLPGNFYTSFNKDNTYQFFKNLESTLSELPCLIIYLPFEGDNQAISAIGQYVRASFANPKLLLDVKYDPRLIAGCALSWKGIYKDYSLRILIEAKKTEITESFKRVLRK